MQYIVSLEKYKTRQAISLL